MTISRNIKAARTAAGLTQEALARKLDVSLMTVSRWENGATPTAHKIVPIAAALNVSPAEILSETETQRREIMKTETTATWNRDTRTYRCSSLDCYSTDGDRWLTTDGHEPDSAEFHATAIRLCGGPRDGETVG